MNTSEIKICSVCGSLNVETIIAIIEATSATYEEKQKITHALLAVGQTLRPSRQLRPGDIWWGYIDDE